MGEFVNLAREYKQRGKFVVSPAPGDGTGWLDTFLGECKDSGFVGVDYIAYHHYVSCNADTSGDGMYWEMHAMLQRHIDLMYKWNDRGFDIIGVWITEIACAPSGGWGNRPYHWEHDKPALLMDKFIDIINNHQGSKLGLGLVMVALAICGREIRLLSLILAVSISATVMGTVSLFSSGTCTAVQALSRTPAMLW